MLSAGIVGLPNVGKSTLFNAVTQTHKAMAANYRFCTIEPNTGIVTVPDERLEVLARMSHSQKIIPAAFELVDIAGLVKGASKGEGLGNQFLSHIREVDAMIYMLRCFEDGNVTHVENSVDPLRDRDIVETELVLSDLESVEKRLPNLQKKAKGGDKESAAILPLMERVLAVLAKGDAARKVEVKDEHERKLLKGMQLLTAKPLLYVCNVDEESAGTGNAYSARVQEAAKKEGVPCVIVSAKIESEIALLPTEDEKKE